MGIILGRAREGNLKAAEMVLQRVWPVRRNRPIEFEVPPEELDRTSVLPEHSSLADAMMNGDIAPQDAVAASRVLDALDKKMRGE